MWSGPEVWPLGSPPLGGARQGAPAGSQAWALQKGQRSGTLLWWKLCTGGTAVFERNHWIFWPCLCPHCKCAFGHRPACTAGVGRGPGSKLSLPFPAGPLSHAAAGGGLLLVELHAFLSSSLCSPTRGLLLLGRLPGGGGLLVPGAGKETCCSVLARTVTLLTGRGPAPWPSRVRAECEFW